MIATFFDQLPLSEALTAATAPANTPHLPLSSLWIVVVPLVLLAVTLVLKKRNAISRRLEILETTDLGAKRTLVLARFGKETLLLGSSEAGVTLLATREYTEPATAANEKPAKESAMSVGQMASAVIGRISRPQAASPAQSFASLLNDDAESMELRRKLVAGRRAYAGSMP